MSSANPSAASRSRHSFNQTFPYLAQYGITYGTLSPQQQGALDLKTGGVGRQQFRRAADHCQPAEQRPGSSDRQRHGAGLFPAAGLPARAIWPAGLRHHRQRDHCRPEKQWRFAGHCRRRGAADLQCDRLLRSRWRDAALLLDLDRQVLHHRHHRRHHGPLPAQHLGLRAAAARRVRTSSTRPMASWTCRPATGSPICSAMSPAIRS